MRGVRAGCRTAVCFVDHFYHFSPNAVRARPDVPQQDQTGRVSLLAGQLRIIAAHGRAFDRERETSGRYRSGERCEGRRRLAEPYATSSKVSFSFGAERDSVTEASQSRHSDSVLVAPCRDRGRSLKRMK